MKIFNKIKQFFHSIKKKVKFKKVKNFFVKYKNILIMCIPFILMDLFTVLFAMNINYTNHQIYVPILFNICYIFLFIGLSISFKDKIGKWIYLFFNILFIVLFLVNNVYYSMTKTFFDFNLIESASEGAPYFLDTLKNCNPYVYVTFILIIVATVFGFKNYPKNDKNNYKRLGIVCLSFIAFHFIIPYTMGSVNKELTWSSWKNTRNIYETFNDNNKSIKVCGFFEYNVRNFEITYLKPEETITSEKLEFLDNSYANVDSVKNKYTGKFKDMNLIIIQLEGMDNWIINKNDTPTIYKLMNNSINFNKHYSYYNGGGSTFNSEFAINTGYITPLSYTKNAYTFNKNKFPNSLANIFKSMNYSVNAFHMNTGEYYSRNVNYSNWGYDNYYGLIDVEKYTDSSYELDRELLLNEKFNELMFPSETKFVDYLITYSGHLPFTNTKGVCKMLYDMDVESEMLNNNLSEKPEFIQMSEEECVRRQASETDYMVSLLLDKLKEKDLYDKTAIVFVTDHYLYTLEDKTILDRYKNTSNNLINNTPFFIWTSKTKKTNIKEVTSQIDVLPTLLNLFGVSYNTNSYIGKDALDSKYKGIVFFSDYSWYDGNVYVYDGEVVNDKKITPEDLLTKNEYISYITKKNDLSLKYDYYNK